MTERDYILVSALQRLRAAEELVRQAKPESVDRKHHQRKVDALMALANIIADLEADVALAREGG
jgi:Co/Zn/Cd efflux system component